MDSTMGSSTGASGTSDGRTMDQVKDQAREVVQNTKEAAGQMMDQAKEKMMAELRTRKDETVNCVQSTADALRTAGRQLRDQNQSMAGQYTDYMADLVGNVSGYLREHDINDMVGDVERFARRQPAVFLGGAFLIGFAAARFFKSSADAGNTGAYGSASYRQMEHQAPMNNPHPANILSPEGQSESAGGGRYLRSSYQRAESSVAGGGDTYGTGFGSSSFNREGLTESGSQGGMGAGSLGASSIGAAGSYATDDADETEESRTTI